jgi:hypothetical protein
MKRTAVTIPYSYQTYVVILSIICSLGCLILITRHFNNASLVSYKLRSYDRARMQLVTGLLVNAKFAWNGDNKRPAEIGSWLLDPLLASISKTVYSSDLFWSNQEYLSSDVLNRFANKTWQQYLLNELAHRPDIDLRPIAQYKRSQECPYYLTYIIDHYHALPDIIFFSHGRPSSHNRNILEHWSWFIERVQHDPFEQFFNASTGFLHANCGIYVQRSVRSRPILDLLGFKRDSRSLASPIEQISVSTYCCAQFIVHRSRIERHPLPFWRLALKLTIDMNDCSHFEHLWHIFFGEPKDLDEQRTIAKWYEEEHPHAERCPIHKTA